MLGCLKDRKWVRNSVPKSETEIGQVGCPWTATAGFRDCKNSPGSCKLGKNRPCVLV